MREGPDKIIKTDNPEEFVKAKSKKSFVIFGLLMILGVVIIFLLKSAPKEGRALSPFRKVMNFNGKIFGALFDSQSADIGLSVDDVVKKARVNGKLGLKTPIDVEAWRLRVVQYSTGDTIIITLEDIKKLPKTDVIFNFKCVEGWSEITRWAGVKFSDFAKAYEILPNQEDQNPEFAGLATPDKKYYVGIDMKSMLHHQTILCYEMNGEPLSLEQGYPLRLIIPVKYGIKHLKRIGTIHFSNDRPADYWAERGYDYYSGL